MNALITGGGRGIGRAVALRLANNGWNVAISSRSPRELAETASLTKGKVLPITADVSAPDDVDRMVERTRNEFGSIDLLVNNAGVAGPLAPFWETDPTEWWRCQEVNVLGPMLCCSKVVPRMMERRKGCIVNLTSGAGLRALPNMGAYALSKAAVIRFSEQLALELAPYGISVFPVRPGVVRTSMVESVRRKAPVVQSMLDAGLDVPPEATADLVEFLASGKADSLSGRIFSVAENWDEMLRRADEIRNQEMYLLRVQELESVKRKV
jgi:NAD(P)-dependent dehydrogenase (short-subunit alcohol dehydrogenase family)